MRLKTLLKTCSSIVSLNDYICIFENQDNCFYTKPKIMTFKEAREKYGDFDVALTEAKNITMLGVTVIEHEDDDDD